MKVHKQSKSFDAKRQNHPYRVIGVIIQANALYFAKTFRPRN